MYILTSLIECPGVLVDISCTIVMGIGVIALERIQKCIYPDIPSFLLPGLNILFDVYKRSGGSLSSGRLYAHPVFGDTINQPPNYVLCRCEATFRMG